MNDLFEPVTVGRLRLPNRLAGGPYDAPDPSTSHGGDHRGHTDYPSLVNGQLA